MKNTILRIIYILLISYSVIISAFYLNPIEWYSTEVMFSDWRNIYYNIDYSTNAIVTQWYCGGHPKYFRANYIQQFINEPDTVTLGLDYYALTPISGQFLPFLFEPEYDSWRESLYKGNVLIIKSYKGRILQY